MQQIVLENKPKILFVFHGSDIHNGGTRSLMDIVYGLYSLNKYNISAIFPQKEGSAIDYLRSLGISEIYSYHYGNLMQDLTQSIFKRMIKFPVMLIRFWRVKSEAKRAALALFDSNIDIVYSNTSAIVFGGFLGKQLKTKQIWHIREFRVKDHRIKFFLGERWLKKFIDSCSQKVLFVSRSVMEENIDIISPSKCVVTYNSYDDSFINPKESFSQDGLNVLVAGDIKPSKGQLVAIEAIYMLLKNNPGYKVKLFLAGKPSNTNYYNKILQFIDDNGIKGDVELLGHVTNMKSLRDNMDVGIVSSDNEAFGRTTIEGMLSMLAMIGKNSGGTKEQIKDGITGLLYNGTADDLCKKIRQLYVDRDLLHSLAVEGFNEAVRTYTHGRCASIVDEAIQSVIINK